MRAREANEGEDQTGTQLVAGVQDLEKATPSPLFAPQERTDGQGGVVFQDLARRTVQVS
jgi:hypothetical protein